MALISNIVRDKQEIKYQLSEQNPNVLPAAQLFTENIELHEIVTKLNFFDFGVGNDLFIIGSPTYGVLGQNRLGDRQSSWDLYAVYARNNKYTEYFGQIDYIDTVATTAAVDINAEEVSFIAGNVLQSEIVTKIRAPIVNARFTTQEDLTNIQIELSNDAGSTWHVVQKNEVFAFPSFSDADSLKYKLTASDTATISDTIAVQINL